MAVKGDMKHSIQSLLLFLSFFLSFSKCLVTSLSTPHHSFFSQYAFILFYSHSLSPSLTFFLSFFSSHSL